MICFGRNVWPDHKKTSELLGIQALENQTVDKIRCWNIFEVCLVAKLFFF